MTFEEKKLGFMKVNPIATIGDVNYETAYKAAQCANAEALRCIQEREVAIDKHNEEDMKELLNQYYYWTGMAEAYIAIYHGLVKDLY